MKKFKDFLSDEDIDKEEDDNILEDENLVVFCWGRFNPPTKGHGMLFSKAYSYAHSKNASFYIFTSQTHDQDKNPLSYEEKVKALKSYFPQYASHIIYSNRIKTLFNAVDALIVEDFDKAVLFVGQDRVNEFQEQMNKYFREKFPVKVLSVGNRIDGEDDDFLDDDDSFDTEFVSGTSAREAAKNGDYAAFRKMSPANVPDKKIKKVFHDIRRAYGVNNEEPKPQDIDIPPERDNFYQSRNEWTVGTKVMNGEREGEIVEVGANYIKVQFLDEDNNPKRLWPWDVKKL